MNIKQILILAVTAAICIGFVFPFFGYDQEQRGGPADTGREIKAPVAYYEIQQIASDAIVNITNETSELIAISNNPAAPGFMDGMYNLSQSVNGTDGMSVEVWNHGTFVFKFRVPAPNAEIVKEINENVLYPIRANITFRGYMGKRLGYGEVIYITAGLHTKKGDYIWADVYQKKNETMTGPELFGLEKRSIPEGPTIYAEVNETTDISVGAGITSNFDLEELKEEISDMTGTAHKPANFVVNPRTEEKTIIAAEASINETTNETIIRLVNKTVIKKIPPGEAVMNQLNNLSGVSAQLNNDTNVTTVSFNNSVEEITKILDSTRMNYTRNNGALSFRLPLDADTSAVNATLIAHNVSDIRMNINGFISMDYYVVFDGTLTQVRDNGHFPAALNLDAKVNDKIRAELQYYTMSGGPAGTTIIPYSAVQV